MRAMKNSGVEWIGEIPVGWDVCKIKYSAKIKSGDGITNDKLGIDGKYEVFGGNGLMGKCDRYNIEGVNIVIGRVGALCGNVRLVNGYKFVSDNALILDINSNQNSYVFYYYVLLVFNLGRLSTSNAQPLITGTNVLKVIIPCLPLPEQTRIASFLDNKCAAIDAAIENQRATIDKLKEYRQAVITEAVTKGLNPDVPMKDSGVEWIGDIPEGWDVCKIKWLAGMKSGDSITSLDIDDESPYPVYGGNGLRGYTKSSTHNGSYILIGRQGALCGNVHIVKGEFWASEHAIVTYELIKLDQKWLFYILSAMNLNQYSTSAAQPGLSVEQIQKLSTFLPPLSEQEEIAAYLDRQCTAIDSAVSKKETLIEKLTEYKKSLIYEAVTGKIEVPA